MPQPLLGVHRGKTTDLNDSIRTVIDGDVRHDAPHGDNPALPVTLNNLHLPAA